MTHPSRRRFLAQTASQAAVLATASMAGWRWSWASERPIRILVGFPPGGGTDVIARLLQEPLSQRLGRTVIIENKPGAGGQIAAQWHNAVFDARPQHFHPAAGGAPCRF